VLTYNSLVLLFLDISHQQNVWYPKQKLLGGVLPSEVGSIITYNIRPQLGISPFSYQEGYTIEPTLFGSTPEGCFVYL